MVTVLHVLLYSVPVSVLRLTVSTSHSLHSSVHQKKMFPITQQFPHTFQHGSHKMEKKMFFVLQFLCTIHEYSISTYHFSTLGSV